MKRVMLVLTVVMATMLGVESCGSRNEMRAYEDCVRLYIGTRDSFDRIFNEALIESNEAGDSLTYGEERACRMVLSGCMYILIENIATECYRDGKVTQDIILKSIKRIDPDIVSTMAELFWVEGEEELAEELYKNYKSAPRVELTMAGSNEYFTQEHDAKIRVIEGEVLFGGAYDEII